MAEYLYSKEHEWALREDDNVRVGISEFAQGELGEIAYVELPEAGKEIAKDDAVCSIDSLKSTSEIYSPVSGEIVEVNTILEDEEQCGLINKDPLGKGWIFVVRMRDPDELSSLMSLEEYESFTDAG